MVEVEVEEDFDHSLFRIEVEEVAIGEGLNMLIRVEGVTATKVVALLEVIKVEVEVEADADADEEEVNLKVKFSPHSRI